MRDHAELRRALLLATARHLPPSPSTLQLADLSGAASVLTELRQDIAAHPVDATGATWSLDEDSMDAVVALDTGLPDDLLRRAIAVLRPGGRLIVVGAGGEVSAQAVRTLEDAGYTRILVEPALEDGTGTLLRGEKPHRTTDTLARVASVSGRDAGMTDLSRYAGRYVYLLVWQTPNKPVWRLQPGEAVRWQAAALQDDDGPVLLAFSGLPRAVNFMQPAVLKGQIGGVNKVAKFKRETAAGWPLRAVLNPDAVMLDDRALAFVDIDPTTAEAADE